MKLEDKSLGASLLNEEIRNMEIIVAIGIAFASNYVPLDFSNNRWLIFIAYWVAIKLIMKIVKEITRFITGGDDNTDYSDMYVPLIWRLRTGRFFSRKK